MVSPFFFSIDVSLNNASWKRSSSSWEQIFLFSIITKYAKRAPFYDTENIFLNANWNDPLILVKIFHNSKTISNTKKCKNKILKFHVIELVQRSSGSAEKYTRGERQNWAQVFWLLNRLRTRGDKVWCARRSVSKHRSVGFLTRVCPWFHVLVRHGCTPTRTPTTRQKIEN